MKITSLSKVLLVFSLVLMLIAMPLVAWAEATEEVTELTADQAGVSPVAALETTSETTKTVNQAGALVEIGNTTAEETTLIVRTTENGQTTDQTVEVNAATNTTNDSGQTSNLSDWIAGDQINFLAKKGSNSGELVTTKLKNRSFKSGQLGLNGWVKAIRADKNEMDVDWGDKVYTLNTASAKLVAGIKNPASLSDFQVGDRIRARLTEDNDGNNLTWQAKIIVVLRRGTTLFMRVTRWVVPAEITALPEDTSHYPYTISAKVLSSKFYQVGDVNNLIGAPGTIITIQVSDKTLLVRRFLGRATIGEFMEGDQIRIIGRLNETTGYLDAHLIKDNSIQRLGVSNRISEVVSLDAANFTMVVKPVGMKNPLTGKRLRLTTGQNWTLNIAKDSKIIKNGQTITLSQINIGDIVRVRGTANRLRQTVAVSTLSVVTDKFAKYLE